MARNLFIGTLTSILFLLAGATVAKFTDLLQATPITTLFIWCMIITIIYLVMMLAAHQLKMEFGNQSNDNPFEEMIEPGEMKVQNIRIINDILESQGDDWTFEEWEEAFKRAHFVDVYPLKAFGNEPIRLEVLFQRGKNIIARVGPHESLPELLIEPNQIVEFEKNKIADLV